MTATPARLPTQPGERSGPRRAARPPYCRRRRSTTPPSPCSTGVADAVGRGAARRDRLGPAGTRARPVPRRPRRRRGRRVGARRRRVRRAVGGERTHRAPATASSSLDPLDGSTNASRGVPWFATSLCVVDDAARRWRSSRTRRRASGSPPCAGRERGSASGASCRRGAATLRQALVGHQRRGPTSAWEWAQFRALGAAALDLCLVAAGSLDAYVDMSVDAHGVWDYLAGALVCEEAGVRSPTPSAATSPCSTTTPAARRSPRPRRSCSTTLLARRREIATGADR